MAIFREIRIFRPPDASYLLITKTRTRLSFFFVVTTMGADAVGRISAAERMNIVVSLLLILLLLLSLNILVSSLKRSEDATKCKKCDNEEELLNEELKKKLTEG
jgi:hypothetical protein